jgi:hypothetical protein
MNKYWAPMCLNLLEFQEILFYVLLANMLLAIQLQFALESAVSFVSSALRA